MNLESFSTEVRGHCTSCDWLPARYEVRGIRGAYCSMGCIETELFGYGHCRWCGKPMDKPQGLTVDSRLCGETCTENYYAHVLGDHNARLGSGKRFAAWLARHQPALYAALATGQPIAMSATERKRKQRFSASRA